MKHSFLILLIIMSMILVGCQSDNKETSFNEESVPIEDTSTDTDESDTDESKNDESESEESDTEESDTEESILPPPESHCRLLSFTVSMNKNRNLCADISGVISDNTVTLTVSAPTDTFSLKNAVIDTETDGISVTFSTNDLTSSDCICTVEDEDGLTRTYDILLFHSPTTIPVISIDTVSGNDITSKEEYTDAVIRIDTTGVGTDYLPEGFESLDSSTVEIRGRGNSTWNWDKKPYKLKFPEKTSVLGMDAAKKWLLLSNHADYSLIRNYVAFETTKVLSNEMAPLSQYPVNLFLNGEYLGVYTIGEDHEVKRARIDLEKNNGTADTSFLLEIGGYNDEDTWGSTAFTAGLIRFCSIEYPEEKELTADQIQFIIDYCTKADSAVRSLDGYEEFIDVDSAIDWFISTELFYNLESCFRRSCFLTKEPGGKLRLGPVWDYDLAMGNLYNDFGQYEIWACLSQANGYIEENWFCTLLYDPNFLSHLRARWNEKKDELLLTAITCIDKMETILTSSAEYNFERWDILGTRAVLPQPWTVTECKTYSDAIKALRDFINNRWSWMDKTLNAENSL